MEKRSQGCVQFGEAVLARRTALGMTQDVLSKRARVHRNYLSSIENGLRNPTLETMERLAEALGVSVVELLSPAPVRRDQEIVT